MNKIKEKLLKYKYIKQRLAILESTGGSSSDIEECRKKLHELEELVKFLPENEEKTVIELRYLRGMSWNEITEKMSISRMTANRKEKKALNYLKERAKI